MPKIECCNQHHRAKSYRLTSEKQGYEYQWLYIAKQCKRCGQIPMEWQGEYKTGFLSLPIKITSRAEQTRWRKRIDADIALPNPQVVSDYSKKSARSADSALHYQDLLERAKQWWKGSRNGKESHQKIPG